MKKVIILLFLCLPVLGQENPYRISNSFNAGELTPLLSAREDLSKYQSGCSLMENMFPIPQGGAQKRPGTKYIAAVKTSSLATRIIPFEYSTDQSYIIELGNQYARFFTDSAQILEGGGTETALNNVVAHWLLNEIEGVTVVDDDGGTHNGTATVDAETLSTTGQVGTGCFDFDGQYAVAMTDHNDFTFDDSGTNPFSLTCWAYITQQSDVQNLLSKWKVATAREWRLSLTNERKLQLHLCDDSVSISGGVSHYKLNDDAADTLVDDDIELQDGNSTPSNTEDITTTGKIGACFDFGGSEAVEIDDQATHSFGDGTDDSPFSIAAWIYVVHTDNPSQTIISKVDFTTSSEAREWRLRINNTVGTDRLLFTIYDESGDDWEYVYTQAAIELGKWVFVVATYDGSGGTSANAGMTLYVDGVDVAQSTGDFGTYDSMENTATQVVIGGRYDESGSLDNQFEGKIDNVMIFDEELTQAVVTNLYNSGNGTETLNATFPNTISDDAISIGWHFLGVTYTGAGGASAANGIILYVDGVAVDLTVTNEASYVAMENTATTPKIGCQESAAAANEKFWADKMDEITVYSDVVTPIEMVTLYGEVPYDINTPYLTADLFELKFEQSADVLFINHPDYETQKLQRYGDTVWEIDALGVENGPFRTQNSDVADFITASATTGTITLTATGCTPFIMGTTAGHSPSGSATTSKSQTGALFKLVHPLDTLTFYDVLEDDIDAGQTEGVSWFSCGTLYEDADWSLITGGTWLGIVEVQRNYTIGASATADGWETVFQFEGVTTARNASTTGTEDGGDADYRFVFADDTSGSVWAYFTTDQTEHIGIVEITSVVSSTSATGTVIKTLASTDATHKWSEGSWSNYRGWPQTVTFFEDRLMFGGNTYQPDTIWGSVTGDYENFTEGADDDDAVSFTLSSRQVNVIQWLVGKNKILIGTSGGEWTLSGSVDEPLTPSNVKAEQQSSFGSENLQATLANESVLFFQRGAEKMRELAYNFELDSYVAPDMTILSNEVTGDGIVDTAFQQIPDSILWCVRDDGELPVFAYERKENITAWSRFITEDSTSDSDFESVAVIHGDPEDEIWVIVERTIDTGIVRYVEQFQPRDFGSDPCDAFYVDCGATYTTDVNVISDLTWLEGEDVIVLADGAIITGLTVASDTVTLGGVYQQVQIGLPYTVQLRTMPLSWIAQGATIQGRIKRINEVIARWYVSGDFYVGKDATDKQLVEITGQTTSEDRETFPPGYNRQGYVFVYQQSPEPLTLLALMIEFQIY